MAIDIQNDELLTLAQACQILPSKPSPATLWRWRTKGVKIDGKSIRLECIRVGRKWYTTKAAFTQFLHDQTSASSASDEPTRRNTAEAPKSDLMHMRLKKAGLIS